MIPPTRLLTRVKEIGCSASVAPSSKTSLATPHSCHLVAWPDVDWLQPYPIDAHGGADVRVATGAIPDARLRSSLDQRRHRTVVNASRQAGYYQLLGNRVWRVPQGDCLTDPVRREQITGLFVSSANCSDERGTIDADPTRACDICHTSLSVRRELWTTIPW